MIARPGLLLAALCISGCVRQESLDPPDFPAAKSTVLVFEHPDEQTMIWTLDRGPRDLPAITAAEGLRVRAIFWDKALFELELIEQKIPTSTDAASSRAIPKLENEQIFETNITAVGATPWMRSLDESVHALRIPLPEAGSCAEATKGDGCRNPDQTGEEVCTLVCPLDQVASPARPAEVIAPARFDPLACPGDQWLDGAWQPSELSAGGERFSYCVPPSPRARLTCPSEQVQLPGTDVCTTIGPACSGEFTAKSLPGRVFYVKPNGSGDGSSPANATNTIRLALTNADDGDTIAVAQGTYAETLVIDKAVRIVGACSGQTTIRSNAATVSLAADATLEDLTVIGMPAVNAGRQGPVEARLEAVVLQSLSPGAFSPSLIVERGAFVRGSTIAFSGSERSIEVSGGALELHTVLADVASVAILEGPTATATISRLSARGAFATSDTLRVLDGAQLVLKHAELVDFMHDGIAVAGEGSVARLEHVALRAGAGDSSSDQGIAVRDGGRVIGEVVSIHNARAGGLLVEGSGSTARLRDSILSGNGEPGRQGAAIAAGGSVELSRVTFDRNLGPGLRLCGGAFEPCAQGIVEACGMDDVCAQARLFEVIVAGGATPSPGEQDYAALIAPGTELIGERVVFAENYNGGLFLDAASDATIEDAFLFAHSQDARSQAIKVFDAAALTVKRSVVAGSLQNPGLSLRGTGSRAVLEHVRFANNHGSEDRVSCGDVNVRVAEGGQMIGAHLDFTGGGIAAADELTEVAISDVTVRAGSGQPGAPLCVREGALGRVDRLDAVGTLGIRAIAGRLILNDVGLASVERGLILDPYGNEEAPSTLIASRVRIGGVKPGSNERPALVEIGSGCEAELDDLSTHGGDTAVRNRGLLDLHNFELISNDVGIENIMMAPISISDGRLLEYQCGIIIDIPEAERRTLYTRMIYDEKNLENAVVSRCNFR